MDGRQLVLVGAPVDEHAAAAEPRPVRRELLRRRRRRLLRRLQRRTAGPLDRVRDLPAVLPQPLLQGHGRRRSRGRSASPRRRSAATCYAADAAAAVPLRAFGRPRARARRSCAAAVRYPTTGHTAPTTSSCSATRCWSPRSRPRRRAPPRLPPGGHVGAVVDPRARRRAPRTSSRTRRSGSRRSMRRRTPRSRSGPCSHTGELADELTIRVFAGEATVTRSLYEDAGEATGPTPAAPSRATARR